MRKPLLWILVLVISMSMILTFSASGCKATKEEAVPAEEAEVEEEAAVEETVEEEAVEEEEEITGDIVFWDMVWGPPEYIEAAQKLVDQFNSENPGITVTYQSIPWAGFSEAFTTAIAGGIAPDVHSLAQVEYADQGLAVPLDSIIEEWEAEGKLDELYDPGMLDIYKYGGVQYGLPYASGPFGIIYRKDILQEAGIEPPSNWDELYEAAKALTTEDQFGFVFPSLGPVGHWCYCFFMMNNGGGVINANGEPDFDNDRNVEALDYLRRFKDEGLAPEGVASYENQDVTALFFQGKAVFAFVSSFDIPGVWKQPEEFSANVEILPVIESPHGLKNAIVPVNGMMSFNQTEYPEASKKFIKWWMENNGDLWTEGNMGFYPAAKPQFELPVLKEDRLVSAFIEEYYPFAVQPYYPYKENLPELSSVDAEQLLAVAFSRALSTDEDSKAILTEINERILKIFSSE